MRYYAPQVGYVHESYHAEDMQAEVTLLRVEQATPAEMDIKKAINVAGPDDSPEGQEMEDVVSQAISHTKKVKKKK